MLSNNIFSKYFRKHLVPAVLASLLIDTCAQYRTLLFNFNTKTFLQFWSCANLTRTQASTSSLEKEVQKQAFFSKRTRFPMLRVRRDLPQESSILEELPFSPEPVLQDPELGGEY